MLPFVDYLELWSVVYSRDWSGICLVCRFYLSSVISES